MLVWNLVLNELGQRNGERNCRIAILPYLHFFTLNRHATTAKIQMKNKSSSSSPILAAFLMMSVMLSASAERDYCPQPAIGILQAKNLTDLKYKKQVFTIMSVSFVKNAGGAAVPIFVDQPDEYYDRLFSRLNGIYLPGGASSVIDSEYADIARKAFSFAKKMYDKGIYYPIWGVCLGIQTMASWAFDPIVDPKSRCHDTNPKMMTLNFTDQAPSSKLFRDMPKNVFEALAEKPMAGHFHKFGVSMKMYELSKDFQELFVVLATNHDARGMEFISIMEARHYPFYALQWHPEKVHFMDKLVAAKDLKQPVEAFAMNKYMSHFLLQEACKNNNSFLSEAERARFLFEKYETPEEFYESINRVTFANFELPRFDDDACNNA